MPRLWVALWYCYAERNIYAQTPTEEWEEAVGWLQTGTAVAEGVKSIPDPCVYIINRRSLAS